MKTFDGLELSPSTTNKIARIGTYVMLVLLELNRIEVDLSDEDVIRIGFD